MLERIFGGCTAVKVVEAIIRKENRIRWMGLREIGRQANLNPGTIYRNIDILVKNKILLEEKPAKRIRIFKLNEENKLVPLLIEFYDKITKI